MGELHGSVDVELVWPRTSGLLGLHLRLPAGSTAEDALAAAVDTAAWPREVLEGQSLGIFSRRIESSHVLRDGDRLEIYRPLQVDPKEARRRRARDAR
ncbi:MAG TPA: RnfH family protein [Dyella sp.]|nr:RnfH family protein [Dyella sp.]